MINIKKIRIDKNRLYLFVTLFFCFFLFDKTKEAYAQSIEQDFKKIDVEIDGVAVSDITSIVEDYEGYIWMGTDIGLLKYNGYEFVRYKKNILDSTSLNDNDVKTLYLDSQDDLWVGTKLGLSRYNRACDCFFHFPSSPKNPAPIGIISDIIEDQNNNIWLAVQNGGLFRYDRESNRFTRFLHQANNPVSLINDVVHVLLADSQNNIWVGTGFGNLGTGLIRFNPATGNVKRFVHDSDDENSLLDNRISSLYEDQKGQLLIGTYKCGLHIYNKEKETFKRIEFDSSKPDQLHAPYKKEKISGLNLNAVDPFVEVIHQDEKGGYWLGTSGKGINYFDPLTKKKSFFAQDLSDEASFTNNNSIRAFFEDQQGSVWLTFEGGVLYKKDLHDRKFTFYPKAFASEIVYESPLNPGTIWAGSEGGGLRKMDLATGELTVYQHDENNEKSIGHNSVRNVYQENGNTLWVGLGSIGGDDGGEDGLGGLDRLDINTGVFEHFKIAHPNGLPNFSHTVYTICEDQQGHLWLSTGSGGLFRSDKRKTVFKPYNFPNPDSTSISPSIFVISMSPKGMLWAGDSELIGDGTNYQYDAQQNRFFPLIKGFEATNILEDENGWLWISTWKNGTLHYNPANKTYRQFTTEDGLSSNSSNYIVEGEAGIYWIGTRFGPCRLDSKTNEITPLNLPVDRFYYGAAITNDGQLFFSTYNKGLVAFYPDQIKGNPYPPKTVISNFSISDVPYKSDINQSKTIKLSHKQNDISIEYVGLHFSDPSKNQHQYKLSPIDDKWVNAGSNLIARYPNLSSGTYHFEVKAANNFGVWNEKSTTLDFVIKPAWWKTWWAYLIYFGLIGLILYQIYQVRTRRTILQQQLLFEHKEADRLKEINKLKSTLYTNITHEFRTPLTVIGGMVDTVKSNIEKKEFEEANVSLDLIQRNGKKLLQLVNEMLDLAKLESGTMELHLIQSNIITYLKYLSESFHSLAAEKNIHLTVYTEVESLVMDFDVSKMASVVSNVLSNAIKFTPVKGKITVHFSKIKNGEAEVFQIKIKDNGIGIDSGDVQNIFSRFYQVDDSISRAHEGTGIGLTLTKEFVELMTGTIEVESKLGKGSVFTIKIPMTNKASFVEEAPIVGDNLRVADAPISQTIPNQNSSSDLPTVLLIEDNQDVAHYIQICLNEKYNTLYAQNGAIGIEMALETIPDIIISDVMMPEKDGFEVCATLKTHELTDHIPIIMLTAKATVQDRLAGLSYGADAYLAKPFLKAELFTRLEQLILLRQKMFRKMEQQDFGKIRNEKMDNSQSKFVEKAIKIIQDNIQNTNFNTAQFASKLHISESQLYRKLKATTDKSTAVFIRSVRLKKAKELLQSTDIPISQIAYEIGFNDPSWFSRAFKEEFGISPSEIRK